MDEDTYFAVLALLGQTLSDRNLAQVMAHLLGIDVAQVLNDIYRTRTDKVHPAEVLEGVQERLSAAGYDDWSREE
jgi:hypothetical protein